MELQEPLRFKPDLHEKIWGGTRLYELLQKGDGTQTKLGETWELSHQDQGNSVVVGGHFGGQELGKLLEQYPHDIYGTSIQGNKSFPLLYKFIHASTALSVQVHPGEGQGGDPKTETWYVVEAPKDAAIIVGLSSQENPEEVCSKLTTSEAPDVLNHIPVQAGDVFFIPAGTVHAITAGLVVYEVQQNSDTTYRLYDWDRVDANGKGRELHIEEASKVIDYRVHNKHKISPLTVETPAAKVHYLVACAYFILKKHELKTSITEGSAQHVLEDTGSFKVLSAIEGSFVLSYGGFKMSFAAGDTLLLPASLWKPTTRKGPSVTVSCVQEGFFIESFVPNLERDVVNPLQKEGYSIEEIRELGGIDSFI
jgi:mannose-6-phosphate isomerase